MHFILIRIQRHKPHLSQFSQSHQATATRVWSTYYGATESSPKMDTFHTSSSCYSLPLQCTAGIHPQSPRHPAWQPSEPVSQTLRPSYLSHVISGYYVGRRILAPPTLWLHKHTDLRALDFAHYLDLWYRPGLASVTCAWSWRVCEINPTILNYIPLQTSNHSDHMGVAVTRYKWCGLTDVGGAECEASAINICVIYGSSVHDRSLVRDNSIAHIPINIAFTNDTVLGCHFLAICVKVILLWKDTIQSHLSTTRGKKWLDCLLHSVQTRSRPTHCSTQCPPRILSPEQNDRD